MAGSGHRSATGLDDRTLGRIDLVLFDADYPDAKAALEDAWRVAVLASDARMRADHERARAAAVRAANERRDPVAARVRTSTALHRRRPRAFVIGAHPCVGGQDRDPPRVLEGRLGVWVVRVEEDEVDAAERAVIQSRRRAVSGSGHCALPRTSSGVGLLSHTRLGGVAQLTGRWRCSRGSIDVKL